MTTSRGRRILTGIVWLQAVLFQLPAQEYDSKVLILNSFHRGFVWTKEADAGFGDVIEQSGMEIDLFYEYADMIRFGNTDDMNVFRQKLEHRYREAPLDLIAVANEQAFNYLTEIRAELFPDIPVIFYGISDTPDLSLPGHELMSGVVESLDVGPVMELILEVHPEVTHIAAVSDLTFSGQAKLQHAREIIEQGFPGIELVELDTWTMDELDDSLQNLPPTTVAIQLSGITDRLGNRIPIEEEVRYIRDHSPLPTYTLWDFRMGECYLGGVVTSARLHGANAAMMALDVLNGVRVNTIPVMTEDPSPTIFDYDMMQKFGLRESDIPEYAIILDKPEGLWFLYRDYLLIGIGSFILLVTMIIILLFSIARKNLAEQKLRRMNENLEVLVAERTGELRSSLEVLQKTQDSLVEARKNLALGELVARLAHRINTPMGICVTAASHIGDISGRIRKEDISDSGTETLDELDQIESLLNNNLKTANGLLESFRHLSSDLSHSEVTVCYMDRTLSTVATSYEKQLKAMDIHLFFDCPAYLEIVTIEKAVTAVLSSLITNSIKHGFELSDHGNSKRIQILVSVEGANVVLEYRDNGKGIQEHHRNKIFEPFYTADFSSEGSGLGLYIVFNIVRTNLKGTISLDQSNDTGVHFLIRFPRLLA